MTPVLTPLILLTLILSSTTPAMSEDATGTRWREVGVRAGISATATSNYFHEYDVSAAYRLPWEFRARSGWTFGTLADFTLGALLGEGIKGFVGSAGPAVAIGKNGSGLEMVLGVNGAVLSRDLYGNRDLNGNFQFISHVGFNYRFSKYGAIGYRYQHMSNAGMNGGSNPGVNLHLIGASWYLER